MQDLSPQAELEFTPPPDSHRDPDPHRDGEANRKSPAGPSGNARSTVPPMGAGPPACGEEGKDMQGHTQPGEPRGEGWEHLLRRQEHRAEKALWKLRRGIARVEEGMVEKVSEEAAQRVLTRLTEDWEREGLAAGEEALIEAFGEALKKRRAALAEEGRAVRSGRVVLKHLLEELHRERQGTFNRELGRMVVAGTVGAAVMAALMMLAYGLGMVL